MSKKVVFPLLAVFTLGLATGALGCQASASMHAGSEPAKPATPPPPPPPPPEPAKPEPPPPPPKALKPVGKAKIENNEIKIPGKIHFDLDKATLKDDAETKDVLKTLLDVMKENPSITRLRVEGHTDDKGAADHNEKLSHERSATVVEWLAKNGIDKSRLENKGWGSAHPAEKNDTEPHREANRRVEFKVWEIDGKQTDAAKADASGAGGGPSAQGVAASGGAAGGTAAGGKPGDKSTPAGASTTTSGTTPPKK